MKPKKKQTDSFSVKPAPQPREQVIRISLLGEDNRVLQTVDPDAISMSQQFPDQKIITIYHNGIPETMSVNQLVKDALLQIKGELGI